MFGKTAQILAGPEEFIKYFKIVNKLSLRLDLSQPSCCHHGGWVQSLENPQPQGPQGLGTLQDGRAAEGR